MRWVTSLWRVIAGVFWRKQVEAFRATELRVKPGSEQIRMACVSRVPSLTVTVGTVLSASGWVGEGEGCQVCSPSSLFRDGTSGPLWRWP